MIGLGVTYTICFSLDICIASNDKNDEKSKLSR